jgi:hypothetical protein
MCVAFLRKILRRKPAFRFSHVALLQLLGWYSNPFSVLSASGHPVFLKVGI